MCHLEERRDPTWETSLRSTHRRTSPFNTAELPSTTLVTRPIAGPHHPTTPAERPPGARCTGTRAPCLRGPREPRADQGGAPSHEHAPDSLRPRTGTARGRGSAGRCCGPQDSSARERYRLGNLGIQRVRPRIPTLSPRGRRRDHRSRRASPAALPAGRREMPLDSLPTSLNTTGTLFSGLA